MSDPWKAVKYTEPVGDVCQRFGHAHPRLSLIELQAHNSGVVYGKCPACHADAWIGKLKRLQHGRATIKWLPRE